MDIQNLVKMANQIAAFFESWPDRTAARSEVTNHLRRFWDPRMRKALLAHASAYGAASGLAPLAAEAVAVLAEGAPQASSTA